jgi:signal transduction histidine kinase/CheY-like chemotaxis protein
MPSSVAPNYDERVLLIAPTRRDGEVTRHALAGAGMPCTVCASLPELGRELGRGVGAVMLTDQVLADLELPVMLAALQRQPSWSSVPIVMLCRDRDQSSVAALRGFERNVTLLDRPASLRTMLSAVQAALRGRRWQYQIRDQIVGQLNAEEALRQADQRKDQFLATLAHDLRNPLAPIRTGLQLLKIASGGQADAARLFDVMERQLRQLVKLIDELLDVSRIATGKVVLQRERVDMRSVIVHAVESAQPALDAAGHVLRVELPERELTVVGDPSRLSQAVGNLLNNAAKYTPNGGAITVGVDQVGGEVVVTVSDTGMGIPQAMLDRVFDLFAQVDRTLDRAQGGLGIGLSLVRSLIGLHGGSVTARSEGADQGSSFEIRLPAVSTAPSNDDEGRVETYDAAAPERRRLRVMVIDDNVDAADTLALLLGIRGHAVRVEYSAKAALDVADAFLPEAIFCDLGMPGMGGHAFAARLRQDRRFASTVLVAVTGWGAEEDQRRSRAAGFDHHLTKPVSAESVDAILSRR